MHLISKESLMRMQGPNPLSNLMAINAGIKLPVSKQADDTGLPVVRPSIEVAREVVTTIHSELWRKTSTLN